MIDRSEVSRALAKALAYKAVGNDSEAANWAAILVHILECEHILSPCGKTYLRGVGRGERV